MANPQPDQFTRLSNELLEAMHRHRFNGTQLRILLAVLRYTYGFQRKSHGLSLDFLATATKTHKVQVKRELDTLIRKRVIIVTDEATFTKPRTLGLNKDYEQWDVSETSLQSTDSLTVSGLADSQSAEQFTPTVSGLAYQERNSSKDNLKEKPSQHAKNKPRYSEKFEGFWEKYPRRKEKQAAFKAWQKAVKVTDPDLLIKAATGYAQECQRDGTAERYIKHATTFLNSLAYEDFLEPAPEPAPPLENDYGRMMRLSREEEQ